MTTVERHIYAQRVFALLGVLYLMFLSVSIVQRSMDRRPLFVSSSGSMQAEDESEQSALRIQEFHRLEVQDGKPKWEVRAVEARYLAATGVTHVTDADVIVYQNDGSQVKMQAKSAKLLVFEGVLERADLAGDIRVELADGTNIRTEIAVYIQEAQELRAAGPVDIAGDGFLIQGEGMHLDIVDQFVVLEHDVRSKFSKGATPPALGQLLAG